MNTDENLIAVLDFLRTEAAEYLAAFKRDPWGNHSTRQPRWQAMVHQVAVTMAGHPEFSVAKDVFFLSRQITFSIQNQSRNLLEQATVIGSKAAVDWYRRVLRVTTTDVDVISEVYGLNVVESVVFLNGVRLVPIKRLNQTPQASAIASKMFVAPVAGLPDRPAAAVLTVPSVLGTAGNRHHEAGHAVYLAHIETIRRTVTALTLSESNTPTTGVSWIDFHDNDLTATGYGNTWQGATYDGRRPYHSVAVDPVAIQWAGKVLALHGDAARKCDVAISRLNLARRRQTPGDQAIDGCIALEALLSDSQGDLTYKLRLRTARLLGISLEERQAISKKIGQFYTLRSKVVHGQSTGSNETDRKVAKDGLLLALEVLRKIVQSGQIPDLQELELGLNRSG